MNERGYWLSSPDTSDLFERLALEIFNFLLLDHGFTVIKIAKDGYGSRITLGNGQTALGLDYEPGGLRIWTILYRLINGRLPAYPINPVPGKRSDLFYLQDLMVAKEPWMAKSELYSELGRIVRNTPITESFLRERLQMIADSVKQYAGEILEGDFAVFEEAQRIKDARIQAGR